MPMKEGGEDGAGGADLLRLAETLAHEPSNTTIGVTLGRVMVGDKARERAEPGAEGEVQGVAAVAKVGSKEVLSRLVDEIIDEVDVNRNGGVRRKGAAEAIDAGEATSDNKARTAHGQRKQVSAGGKVVVDCNEANAPMVKLKLGGGGTRGRPIPTHLEGYGPVESTNGERAMR